jgi:hypothetical protein
MAHTAVAVACLLLALSAAAPAWAASSPAPTPAVDCIEAATSLADCLDYVSPGSATSRPTKTCCVEVKTAVANPALVDCLCAAMGSKNLPIPIDMKRVLVLPGACGASNAAFSKCHSESLMLLCFFHLGSLLPKSLPFPPARQGADYVDRSALRDIPPLFLRFLFKGAGCLVLCSLICHSMQFLVRSNICFASLQSLRVLLPKVTLLS